MLKASLKNISKHIQQDRFSPSIVLGVARQYVKLEECFFHEVQHRIILWSR